MLVVCQKSNLLYKKGAETTVSFTTLTESHRIASACVLSKLNSVLKV